MKFREISDGIPKHLFAVSFKKSIYFFILDLLLVLSGMFFLYKISNMEIICWKKMLILLPLQMMTGFFMWCLFVVGHDCGHNLFSSSTAINHLFGEISHSFVLLTPFYPWKKSHQRHHLNHNHVKKDYSHTWIIKEQANLDRTDLKILYNIRAIFPFLAWPIYLFAGIPDGGHFILYGRLWKRASVKEYTRGAISSLCTAGSAYMIWNVLGNNIWAVYIFPWIFYGWWLFTVTFLQHHAEDLFLYGDASWTYLKGAFQTIDRDYGSIINYLSHNITDCHIVHHLFFTSIPHYHLKEANEYLLTCLKKHKQTHLYKKKKTHHFWYYIFQYYIKNWQFISRKFIA